MKKIALVSIGLLAMGVALAKPARAVEPPAEQVSPATQPADELSTLIAQLGDDDFHVRLAAAKKIKAIGPSAIPALQQASKSNDPEVQTRAAELLADLQHPVAADEPMPQPTGFGNQSISIAVVNGRELIDISEPGRTTHIEQAINGISMRVTGTIDSHPVTREYKAANPDELQKKSQAAYVLYRQYAAALPPGMMRPGLALAKVQLNIGGAGPIVPGGIVIPPGPNIGLPVNPRRSGRLGITVNEQAAPGQGLIVTGVFPGLRADNLGLQPKDEIQKINGKDVHTQADVRELLATHPAKLVIDGLRDGKPLHLEEKPQ